MQDLTVVRILLNKATVSKFDASVIFPTSTAKPIISQQLSKYDKSDRS